MTTIELQLPSGVGAIPPETGAASWSGVSGTVHDVMPSYVEEHPWLNSLIGGPAVGGTWALAQVVAADALLLGERVRVTVAHGEKMDSLPLRSGSGRREKELEWLRTHRDELRALVGKWVVVEGDEIISMGPSPSDAVRGARQRGVQVPFVYRVDEERSKGVVHIGL
ncbi:MAG: hypothetical protein HYV93_13595 [Candidatus Rokubacteria bacterium]|nr:hypothetical protein [Candidatus Rokubacteria bacterium]